MHALPVKFHLKSLFPSNLFMPAVYLVINISTVIGLINIVLNVKDDETLNFLAIFLLVTTLFTITFYLLSAYTNPGLLIGNE